MKKILVTGGAGNIASSLVRKLAADSNNEIVIVDNLLTGSMKKVPVLPGVTFVKCDVNDLADISGVFYRNAFDYVFHYAAVVGVQRTLNNPLMVLNDIKGIENVLKLSKNTGVKRVFYSSSSEVYGEPFEIPQNEFTTPLNSRLPYAIVKNLGEAYCRSFAFEYGLHFTIFRFFNTYGPSQSEDFVIPRFIKSALQNQDIEIYGDGNQTRTFCYIDDNIDACITCIRDGLFIDDVVNIGSDNEISILELAKTVIRITGSQSKINFLPALKEGDMSRRCPDNAKMKEIINRPLISLEDGISRLVRSYSNELVTS
ncbi:NAD-dependent epimerase/dehydratase family protein [Flavitalea sp.]|nr:NAD-dependent epimerase/dehydratase family protein [Flavitalea sp.]